MSDDPYTLDTAPDDMQDKIDKAIVDQLFSLETDLVEQLISQGKAKGTIIVDGDVIDFTIVVASDDDDDSTWDITDITIDSGVDDDDDDDDDDCFIDPSEVQ